MSIKRFLLGNDCDGDSGRCLADMVGDQEGDYVRYEDYAAEVERLRAEKDAVKIAAWDKSSEQLREMARLRLERDALRADAERYRWLRDNACHEWFDEDYPVQIVNQVLPVHPAKWREETDAAIDAARGES